MLTVLVFLARSASAQVPPWTNDWIVPGPPTLRVPGLPSRATFAPDGDIVVASQAASRNDLQLVRLAPTGTLRWAVNLEGNESYFYGDGMNALLATTDGNTFAAFGGPDSAFLTRIDIDGVVKWSRHFPADWLIDSPGALIAGGCGIVSQATFQQAATVTSMDRETGNVAWQVFIPPGFSCPLKGVVGDAQGNVFLTIAQSSSTAVEKIDSTGHTVWTMDLSSAIGADATHLYLSGPWGVRAIRLDDAGEAWTSACPGGVSASVLPPDSAGPVVLCGANLLRFAAADGATSWSAMPPNFYNISVSNGAIMTTSPGVTRIDATTGALLWSQTLPAVDAYGNAIGHFLTGAIGEHTLLTIEAGRSLGAPPLFLQPLDFDTGTLLQPLPLPAVGRGLSGSSIVDSAHQLVAAATTYGAEFPEIHLRRLNSIDGSLQWETSETAVYAYPGEPVPWDYWVQYVGVATNSDSVAAAAPENAWYGSYSQSTGVTWVGLYDLDTGAKRWSVTLADPYQRYTWTSDPVLMANGDVVVGVGAPIIWYYSYPTVHIYQRTIYRLAASDGHVIWRRDATFDAPDYPGGYVSPIDPPVFTAIGDDVVGAGPFETAPMTSTLVRLAGATGTTIWASPTLASSYPWLLTPVSGGSFVAVGNDAWARIDADTGSTNWTAPAESDCNQPVFCVRYGSVALSNGDVLSAGESNNTPMVIRRRGDGSGIKDVWYLEPPTPGLRTAAVDIAADAAGKVWLRLSRIFRDNTGSVQFLARFDPDTGALLAQQAVGNSYGDPLRRSRSASMLAAPTNNRLPVDSFVVEQPEPATRANAILDTTVTATGDLSVEVHLATSIVMPGTVLPFHFVAKYTGDKPLAGSTLLGIVPWSAGLANVNCTTQGASNCLVKVESGNVEAAFDITPGGQIDVSGQVTVLPWPDTPYPFHAAARGPIGLSESNTLNNFVSVAITQSLFRDGFD